MVTIIVGIKCKDGVVLGSDSQQEFGRGVAVKRLNTGKIYKLNERFSIAGAGTTAHIEKAIDSINIALNDTKRRKGGMELCEDDCVNAIERAMIVTHKTYNIERATFLEDSREKNFFNPILICGCLERIDKSDNACLFIIHTEGVVEKITDYATAGSGAAYAELLLKNYYSPELTVNEAIPLVLHAISEVIDIDPNCGGLIRVTTVKPDGGIKMLTNEEINQLHQKTESLIDMVEKSIIPKILRGEVDAERIGRALQ
jgi:20S proteasome alpha/beta subunit